MADTEDKGAAIHPLTGTLVYLTEFWGPTPVWAFQETRYIEKPVQCHTRCSKCGTKYDGLIDLKNGDHLTIYSQNNPDEKVWSGTIKFPERFVPDKSYGGYGIPPQEGVDRDTWVQWFNQNYPATLLPK